MKVILTFITLFIEWLTGDKKGRSRSRQPHDGLGVLGISGIAKTAGYPEPFPGLLELTGLSGEEALAADMRARAEAMDGGDGWGIGELRPSYDDVFRWRGRRSDEDEWIKWAIMDDLLEDESADDEDDEEDDERDDAEDDHADDWWDGWDDPPDDDAPWDDRWDDGPLDPHGEWW